MTAAAVRAWEPHGRGKWLHRCDFGPALIVTERIMQDTHGCTWCRGWPPPMVAVPHQTGERADEGVGAPGIAKERHA